MKFVRIFSTILFSVAFILTGTRAALADSDWIITGNDMYSGVSGNVGIGTTSPAAKFHVNATSQMTGLNVTQSSAPGIEVRSSGGSTPYIDWSNDGSVDYDARMILRGNDDLSIEGTDLGIGGAPGTPFHVYKNSTTTDATAMMRLEQDDTGDTVIDFLLTGVRRWLVGIDNSDNESFKISESNNGYFNDTFVIKTSGDVGIGTGSPAKKLHVAGEMKVDSTINGPNSGDLVLQSTTADDIVFNTNGAVKKMTIKDNGKVGIGTDDPAQELHVAGDLKVDSRIYGPNSGNLVLQSTSNDSINFRTEDNGLGDVLRMKITEIGRVGINNSNPDAKLHVVGDIAQNQGILHVNATKDTGTTRGIFAEADSVGSNSLAIFGLQSQPDPVSAGGTFGVFGRVLRNTDEDSSAHSSAGVFGEAIGNKGLDGEGHPIAFDAKANGVQGETWSTNDGSAGVKGFNSQDSGTADGVHGQTNSSATGSYGVYSAGPGGVSGSKSAVVYTESQGPTEFYSVESTEIWFEDMGIGTITNGTATIQLDQIFNESTVIDERNPMLVFLAPYGDVDLYSVPQNDSFQVIEKDGGVSSNVQFAYRVVAKRRFYEDVRTRATPVTIDPFMRPDLTVEDINVLNDSYGYDHWQRGASSDYPTAEELTADKLKRETEQAAHEASIQEGADNEPNVE